MMFQPIDFVGIKPPYLGWQGIIPRNAAKMAGISVDLMTSQLISVREVFQRLDPERVARELEPALIEAMDRITRDVAERFQPGLWNALPEFVRTRLVQPVQAELPDLITEIMGDVRDHIDRLFDLKTRSEERRVGKECVSTGRTRWWE